MPALPLKYAINTSRPSHEVLLRFLLLCAACCLSPAASNVARAADAVVPTASVAAMPHLGVGDPAPALAVGRWIKGEPIRAFDRDHAYLLEFWATWCGPCKASIPHVNELHHNFADKGLVVIGQNVFEGDQAIAVAFVAAKGDGMSYRVALDDMTNDKDGIMATTWLSAAGQHGIPVGILVGKDGRIAWIGHPMELTDTIIKAVLAGTYDLGQAKREAGLRQLLAECEDAIDQKNWTKVAALRDKLSAGATSPKQRQQIALLTFQIELQKGDLTAVCVQAETIAAGTTDPDLLNMLAWNILTAKNLATGHIAVGLSLAQRASLSTQGKNASIQDTLARALFLSGKRTEAVAIEKTALDAETEESNKALYSETLKAYSAGKLPEHDTDPNPAN